MHISVELDGDGCWPDLNDKHVDTGEVVSAAYLTQGMSSGNPSISLRIHLDDGRIVIAQTSLRLFLGVAAAFCGKGERDGIDCWRGPRKGGEPVSDKEICDELKAGLVFQMPPGYPDGMPLYWQHETSGVLAEAVKAYVRGEPLSAAQLDLLKHYVKHWINAAPGWIWPDEYGEISRIEMLSKLALVSDRSALSLVLHELLEVQIDPL